MKTISIISGDKRQFYIKEYLKNNGYNAEIITNMDFNNTDIIVAGTPFVKNNEYINCDYYTGFPVDTFLGLLKPKQIVFAGSISENIMKLFPKNIKLIDVLKDVCLLFLLKHLSPLRCYIHLLVLPLSHL